MTGKQVMNPIIKALKGFLNYFATPAMLVFLIWYVATYKKEREMKDEALKDLIFDNTKQKVKIVEFSEMPYSPIAVYKQSEELIEQSEKLDSSYVLINKIFEQKMEDDSIKKIDKIKIDKSRNARDSVNRLILQKLDSLQ